MSSPQTLNGFLKQFFEDRSTGKHRTLDEYVGMFPGSDAAIAEHYERFEAGEPAVEARGPSIERVGRYRIVREIGRGGQGVVYHAEDVRLGRMVALKMLTGLGALAPSRVARFLREAEVASRLDHPGIATVYEVGTEDGVPFIAMQFVEGETLAARLAAGGPGAVAISVSIVEKCARALHAAHEAGVVHRDVKPGNILIQADGDPVIVDFGLAHDADADMASLTKSGEFFGTPAYMSPEQIETQPAGRPDRRTDVWSLGVTLYECLTLRRPFEAPTREGLYRAVLMTNARDPRELNEAVTGDLRIVLETALERDRDRRYQTALDLAEDLRRVRVHEPILAKPVGNLIRLRCWAARNPSLATSLGALFTTLALGLGVALSLYGSSEHERVAKDVALTQVTSERNAKQAIIADYDRLGDVPRLAALVSQADDLWPAGPASVPSLRSWVDQGAELAAHFAAHRAILEHLRPRDGASFATHADQFKYETTAKLVADLSAFVEPDPAQGLLAAMRARLEFAETVERRTIVDQRAAWEAAIRSIADRNECPKYAGLAIRPQLGLIPIGRDARSGLWEFAHLQTAGVATDPVPRRGSEGQLVVTEATGIVLVLLPGGSFGMGAAKPDDDQAPSAPNVDAAADPREAPVTEVSLDPFFMSKYEMTQGQWTRLTGKNPSSYAPGGIFGDKLIDLRHPVEQVSGEDCDRWLPRAHLALPTEAQWEYAARGGTTTPRWTGIGTEGLARAANLSDKFAQKHGAPPEWKFEAWEDDYVVHAPVGSYAANPFGLHDVLGNVWELCEDAFLFYTVTPRPGDGLRADPSGMQRICRGGSFADSAAMARSAGRNLYAPKFRYSALGVRPARRLDP